MKCRWSIGAWVGLILICIASCLALIAGAIALGFGFGATICHNKDARVLDIRVKLPGSTRCDVDLRIDQKGDVVTKTAQCDDIYTLHQIKWVTRLRPLT